MNTEARIRKILAHDCPETGYSCPGCDERVLLHYRIDRDEYVCGACGLVSTVNEVVEHSRELRRKGEVEVQTGSAVTLRPMFDRVLIRPLEVPKTTESGLVIPDSVKPETKIRKGKVLAVGKGDRLKDGSHVNPFCRPGDTVLYTSNPNQDWEMEIEDKKVMCSVINEEQFLYAILD